MNEIPKTTADEALDLLNQSFAKIEAYLNALTPEDRRALPKVSDGTESFMEKSMDYLESNGQFRPGYMNVGDVKSNYTLSKTLVPFFAKLTEYCSLVSDTKMKAGSEAYSGALQYYNSLQIAVKNRVPGAKSVYEELKKRFEKKKVNKEEKGAQIKAA